MSEDSGLLSIDARRVVEGCELYLEVAGALVLEIPKTREEVLARIAAAKKLKDEAHEEMLRVCRDESASRAEKREAERAYDEAHWRHFETQQELGSDHLDPENRKAVVRQLAGLIREDAEQRLDAIASRSDDPELRRTVAESKEQVQRATRYVLKRFAEAKPLQRDEVRKARAEASEILALLKNPPAD